MAEKVVIGNAELWHVDCREVLPLLPQSDLILTDPPYGIGINKSHRLATSRGHGGETWDDKPVPQWLMLMLHDWAQDLIVWGGYERLLATTPERARPVIAGAFGRSPEVCKQILEAV